MDGDNVIVSTANIWGWWWMKRGGEGMLYTAHIWPDQRPVESAVSRSIMDSACCRCLSSCWKLNLIDGPLENFIKYISRLYSIKSHKALESRYLYAFPICKLCCGVDLQWYQNMYFILAAGLVWSQVVVLFQPPYKYLRVSPCHPGMSTAALYPTTTQLCQHQTRY